MPDKKIYSFLFVVNKKSGANNVDWHTLISDYFKNTQYALDIFDMPGDCNKQDIINRIETTRPDRLIAVGGDGTVKLLAECVVDKNIAIGILPAGSANGMAKELGIVEDAAVALGIAVQGIEKRIHLVKINEELCIHLSDMGFNAHIIREFEHNSSRGMWGYFKASWSALWKHTSMEVNITTKNAAEKKKAAMIVIANATKYGTGALINPEGKLDDDLFEVIVIKRFSLQEIFKMMVTHQAYDTSKTEVYQTNQVNIRSKKPMHFQVDGEYLGKVQTVKAVLLPNIIKVIVPATAE